MPLHAMMLRSQTSKTARLPISMITATEFMRQRVALRCRRRPDTKRIEKKEIHSYDYSAP